MKNTWSILLVFGLIIGSAAHARAWDNNVGNPANVKPAPAREEKAPAKKPAGAFDETAAQYLKKFRGVNASLVAAHEEVYRIENPDRSTKGMDMRNIFDEQKAGREKKEQEQSTQNKKATLEEKIKSLQKDAENLWADLEKHYKGSVPKNVADAWKTEQDYTDYRISKYR